MPVASTPSSNSSRESWCASAASPTITGVMGVSLIPVLKPAAARPCLEIAGVVPQLFDALGLLLQDVECRQAGRRHGRRMRSRKQERPRAVVQKLDQVAAAADVPAEHADGFRERAHLHLHAPVQAEMVDGAAAVAAQHAGGMRVVHHHDGAVLFGRFHQAGQRADVAVHGEHAVGDQQLAAGHGIQFGQNLLRRGHVLVREDVDLGPRQAAAVDDAGVVQLVGDDVVFRRRGSPRRCRRWRRIPIGTPRRPPTFLNAAMRSSSSHVHAHGAGDGAHRARTRRRISRTASMRRLAQLGMRGQPEIIVGGEVDDLLCRRSAIPRRFPIPGCAGAGRCLRAPLFELIVKIRERISLMQPLQSFAQPPVAAGEMHQRLAIASPARAPFRPRKYRDRPR